MIDFPLSKLIYLQKVEALAIDTVRKYMDDCSREGTIHPAHQEVIDLAKLLNIEWKGGGK